MKKNIMLIGALLMSLSSFCKNLYLGDSSRIFKTLYIIQFEDRAPIVTKNAYIDLTLMKDYQVLNHFTSKDFCAFLGVDQVLALKMPNGTKLYNLKELYEKFHLENRHRNLRVKLDGEMIDYPQTFVMSAISLIDKIKLSRDKEGYFVHIILKGYE